MELLRVQASDQWKLVSPRIRHVARNIQQVFSKPDKTEIEPRIFLLAPHFKRTDTWHEQLHKGPAVDHKAIRKYAEKRMASFMKSQIGGIKYGDPTPKRMTQQQDSYPDG